MGKNSGDWALMVPLFSRPWAWLAAGWVLLVLCGFVLVPVLSVLYQAFSDTGSFTTFVDSFFDPALLGIVRMTSWQAAWSTAISVALGVPLGLWAGSARGRIGGGAEVLLAIPYGVPTAVAAMVGITWLGRTGFLAALGLPLDWAYSLNAVVTVHVFLNAPWVALLVAQARRDVPQEQWEAARTLGAGFVARMKYVVRPYIQWTILSAATQVFGLCSMSFALVLLLGGGPPVQTLETAIYTRMRYGGLDISGAVGCAVWELLLTLVPWMGVLWIQTRWKKRLPGCARLAGENRQGVSVFSNFMLLSFCSLALVPYFPVLTHLRFFSISLLQSLASPILLSFKLAMVAMLGAVVTAIAGIIVSLHCRGHRPWISSFVAFSLTLPAGISVLVLGLGMWIAYGRWIDPFEGSFFAMAALQSVILIPLVLRVLWPVGMGIQVRLLEAASSLGASPFKAFWWVEWPRWKRPLFSAAAVATGASLGEVAAVSLFSSEKFVSLPLIMTRWLIQYRFEEAQAVSVLLLLFSAGTIAGTLILTKKGREKC